MTVNFYLDKKSKKEEKTIFCYIRGLAKNKTIVLHTGEKIEDSKWDSAKQKAKRNYVGSPELNSYLVDYKEGIKRFVRLYKCDNPDPDYDELKKALLKKFKNQSEKKDFFEIFDDFLEIRKNDLSNAMIKKYKVLKNHLQDFEKNESYPIAFSGINLIFYDKFRSFLMDEKRHTNNTISKYLDNLKTYMRWATDRNLNSNMDFIKFKGKHEETDIVYLTDSELMQLYRMDLTGLDALAKVRDVFCFTCFTGQRFSDVFKIRREGIKGEMWYIRVKKTKDTIDVPLNIFALSILEKYKTDPRPLPIISAQKTNQKLKELCKLAGFYDPVTKTVYRGAKAIETTTPKYECITTHTGRRTFVTLSLEKGMRHEVLMKITGHRNYKAFKKYIKITAGVKVAEMNEVWKEQAVS